MARKKKVTPQESLPLDPPAGELRVLSVKVRNVLGIEERAIDPGGRTTLVTGRNGTQKTSLLTAVQAGLGGGSLAKLARVGTDEDDAPEVVLVLKGTGGEYRVEKRGDDTARVMARVGESQAFADVPRPQQFLSGLFDPRMSNPVAWLMAKPADQAVMLLEALPLELDEAELAKVLKGVARHVQPVPAGLHPLEHLSMVRGHLFSARTGVNRDSKQKAEAANQLRRELPAEGPGDVGAEIERAEAEAAELADHISTERQKIEAADAAALDVAKHAFETGAAEARAEYEAKLRDLEAKRSEAKEAAAHELAAAEGGLVGDEEKLAGLREELAGLREESKNAARFEALEEQAEEFETAAAEHEKESERLTAALKRLDAFRRALAKNLPIDGLEIEGAEIKLDGIPLAQVNEARRVEVAAKVAEARAALNPLKVVFLDGLERLDSEHREALLAYLVEHDVQAFGAVVTDDEPGVRYVGAVTS